MTRFVAIEEEIGEVFFGYAMWQAVVPDMPSYFGRKFRKMVERVAIHFVFRLSQGEAFPQEEEARNTGGKIPIILP